MSSCHFNGHLDNVPYFHTCLTRFNTSILTICKWVGDQQNWARNPGHILLLFSQSPIPPNLSKSDPLPKMSTDPLVPTVSWGRIVSTGFFKSESICQKSQACEAKPEERACREMTKGEVWSGSHQFWRNLLKKVQKDHLGRLFKDHLGRQKKGCGFTPLGDN